MSATLAELFPGHEEDWRTGVFLGERIAENPSVSTFQRVFTFLDDVGAGISVFTGAAPWSYTSRAKIPEESVEYLFGFLDQPESWKRKLWSTRFLGHMGNQLHSRMLAHRKRLALFIRTIEELQGLKHDEEKLGAWSHLPNGAPIRHLMGGADEPLREKERENWPSIPMACAIIENLKECKASTSLDIFLFFTSQQRGAGRCVTLLETAEIQQTLGKMFINLCEWLQGCGNADEEDLTVLKLRDITRLLTFPAEIKADLRFMQEQMNMLFVHLKEGRFLPGSSHERSNTTDALLQLYFGKLDLEEMKDLEVQIKPPLGA